MTCDALKMRFADTPHLTYYAVKANANRVLLR